MQCGDFINSQNGNLKLVYKSYFYTHLKEVDGTL